MAQWTQTTITVNGQTYQNVEEMPPDVHRQYEQAMSMLADRNSDGVPDIMEGQPPGKGTVVTKVTTSSQSFLNDRGAGTVTRTLMEQGGRGGVTFHLSWGVILLLAIALAATGAGIAFLLQR